MSDQEQTVTEADDQTAQTGPEDDGAQDIEAALKEFENASSSEQTEPEKPKPSGQSDVSDVVDYVRELREKEARETTQKDIAAAVETVKENVDLNIPDSVIKNALYGKASEDPRFLRAFQYRGENPEQWSKVLKALGQGIAKEFEGLADRGATDDREAVASAVRGASTKAQEQETDYSEKSVSSWDRDRWIEEQKKAGVNPF